MLLVEKLYFAFTMLFAGFGVVYTSSRRDGT
jgi:hypothetical protein